MPKIRKLYRQPLYESKTFVTLQQRVAKRLKEIRDERELTQDAVAALCGMKTQQYQKIEWARVNLTFTTLAKLADGLAIDAGELLVAERRKRTAKRVENVSPLGKIPKTNLKPSG